MKNARFLLPLIVLCLVACSGAEQQKPNYQGNRLPLQQEAFMELPLGSITPAGWLREMLISQKNGATGHLDEMYPEVMGPRNGWLGGDGDQWERGPYWIDGLLPLAYILDDEELKEKVQPWIEWSLASQQEDGYFGPVKDYGHEPGLQRNKCRDWWPKMVMLKVMMQYYSATGDERVIDFMTRYFHYQLDNLDEFPLDHWSFWGRFRGGDNMMAVYWLYNITGDRKLLDLGDKLYAQTEPYVRIFLERDKLTRPGTIHAVNLAQGLKTPVVYWQADPDPVYLEAMDCAMDDLRRFHGYPVGIFSGDEDIHGNDPTQGIELCTIVEFMFSLETMYKITGNPEYADLLEKVAYNALPAQVDDNFINRQYFQQVNQVRLTPGMKNFDVNHNGLDHCFGFLTGYPCCTSNMHQGWPKFTQNLWYATRENGVAVSQYAPSEVEMLVADSVRVRIVEDTAYPFEETVRFTVSDIGRPAEFGFSMRIPGWSDGASVKVNGKPLDAVPDSKGMVTIVRRWCSGDTVELEFVPETRLTEWKENAVSVERGPLVYALKMDSRERKVRHDDGSPQGRWHYEHESTTPWNYALIQCPEDSMEQHYEVIVHEDKVNGLSPWSEEAAPISIMTRALTVPSWKEYNNMAGPLPYSIMYGLETGEERMIELIPYGCTTLRITEFPMKGKHSAE